MTPHRVDRVRIRPGPGPDAAARARRLTRVAHTHLSRELDQALAGAADLVVDRIVVTLDPADLDDEALATLWATLIRDAVNASPSARQATKDSTPADVAALLLTWAEAAIRPPEPVLARLRSSARLVDEAIARLPSQWRQAVRQLIASGQTDASNPAPTTPSTTERVAATPDRPTLPIPAHHDGTSSQSLPGLEATPPSPPHEQPVTPPSHHNGEPAAPNSHTQLPTAEPSPAPPTAARLPPTQLPLARLAPAPGGDGVSVSAYGGLALLYVRLRPALERAPGVDELTARLTLLALVADEEPERALTDPLVRLLAGDPGWRVPRPAALVPHDPAIPEMAGEVLRAFAGDLPGFGLSSPGFVRDEWVRRTAILLDDGPDVLLRLGRRPLDLVLDRLPYPVGAFRFPWTPTIFVGWEAP